MNNPICYLILKRGLYYRPAGHGYTGIKAEAGRFTRGVANVATYPNGKDGPRDGMTYIHEDDAPEYSPSCAYDVKLNDLEFRLEILKNENDKLRSIIEKMRKN